MISLSSTCEPSVIQGKLHSLVKRIQRRALLQRLIHSLVFVVMVWAGLYLTLGVNNWLHLILTCTPLLACWQLSRSAKYKTISEQTLLQHLNREFPECEESAHLITLQDESLSLLQKLQKKRIESKVESILDTDLSTHLPSYPSHMAIGAIIFVLLVTMVIKLVGGQVSSTPSAASIATPHTTKPLGPITITSSAILIQPPAYTGLPDVDTTDFNLQLVAGSTVTWRIQLSSSPEASALNLKLAQEHIEFTENTDGSYSASSQITETGIYFVTHEQQAISDIFTLAVTVDSPPTIRFITPTQTITEIPKNAQPKFVSRVQIQDDFGLSKVEILGSIASGSGESVKFRDQTFKFDSQTIVDGQNEYYKEWNLSELGMQPGDELYFSVRAYDNAWKQNQPAPQLSRSANKIVRWIEEEQEGIQSEGILLDFMPEYFKSQRQIIIETQELIANKNSISEQEFVETSRSLGISQNDLKKKYGQFLGDEFESGTMHSMESGLDHHHEEDEKSDKLSHPILDAHEKQDEHEKAILEEAKSHAHEDSSHEETNADKSGYSQVIAEFGHAHGATDDGNFIKRGVPSPITLMKRSIANMWQAELHLQLAEPAKALPYENQALEFLNRAKRAERIYVKRLGFEPPPVSEKRRYEGDLSDILSYQRSEQIEITKPNLDAIKRLLNLLNHSYTTQSKKLNVQQLADINLVKTHFTEQLANSPDNIVFIATLEKISLATQLTLQNCDDCLINLREKLWQDLPEPIAEPTTNSKTYLFNNPAVQQFSEFIQKSKHGDTP